MITLLNILGILWLVGWSITLLFIARYQRGDGLGFYLVFILIALLLWPFIAVLDSQAPQSPPNE